MMTYRLFFLIRGRKWLIVEQKKHFTVYSGVLSAVQDCKTHKNAEKVKPTNSQMEAQKATRGVKPGDLL